MSPNIVSKAADIFYQFPRVIDLGLGRMKQALALLGRPEQNLPPTIHIAGTNGKGSTLAMLRAILEAAGKKVHVYSSPHLVHIEERYRIAGKLIAPDALEQLAQKTLEISHMVPLTIFEAETLAGFLAFAQTPADYLLLETGLGGRLDATNIIDQPALTLISPIDLDHQHFLGETITAIAGEKAGIIKKNCPLIIGPQCDEALEVLEAEAHKKRTPMKIWGQDFNAQKTANGFEILTEDQCLDLPLPNLIGYHQIENATLSAMAALSLGIAPEHISAGLRQAKWPARLQWLRIGRFAELGKPSESDIWLDGAHNPHGANAAIAHFKALQAKDPVPFYIIVGMLNTKDAKGFFELLAPLRPVIFTCPIASSDQSISPKELAKIASDLGLNATPTNSAWDAAQAIFNDPSRKRVAILGSLYLAGEILADVPPE